MAADSDGLGSAGGGGGSASCGVVVTCEGDLRDPRFPARLRRLLRELRALLAEPQPHTLKVHKVEPWNSVRVTLSVPRAAAARLRALAAAGAPQLRALGILSVQLDGDAAVSLRLQHGTELRINTDPDDASTSRTPTNPEVLSSLGGIGRLLSDDSGASTSSTPDQPRDSFKSPNTVCPRDGKIPQNIPTPADRCEYPFGSMTQARVIHRKENTLGLGGPSSSIRAEDPQFARAFPAPPPYPGPANAPATSVPQHTPPLPSNPAQSAATSATPGVALSSPLLVNLLQNEAPAPQPRTKQHPAKLDRLEDAQVELAVGRAPFEYRSPRPTTPRPPPPSPLPAPQQRPTFIRRTFPAPRPPTTYRPPSATVVTRPRYPPGYAPDPFQAPPPPPPPPYRQQVVRRALPPPSPRVTPDELRALLPPPAAMDQKTQSSFQEFQRYQQQYNARQRAASRAASQPDWNEPYRDTLGLSLPDLPDNCDLDQLLPTLGADLNLDDTALSAISDLDSTTKLDLLYDQQELSNQDSQTPDSLLQEITGLSAMNGPYEPTTSNANTNTNASANDVPSSKEFENVSDIMPPPPAPVSMQSTSKNYSGSSPIHSVNTHNVSNNSVSIQNASSQLVNTQNATNQLASTQNQHASSRVASTQNQHASQQMASTHNQLINTQNASTQAVNTQNVSTQLVNTQNASTQLVNTQNASTQLVNTQNTSNQSVNNANAPFKSPPPSFLSPSSSERSYQSSLVSQSSSMPPPMRLPMRAAASVATATVGSQATAQEIEEQSKQYLIKTLMRDDDSPPPKEQEKKVEEVTVAQCKVKESLQSASETPEIFGIAKSTIEEDKKPDDDKKRLLKKDDKIIAQKGGKPRTGGAKEKPASLKDKILRDGKTKVALSRPAALIAKPAPPATEAPKSPGEKESIKLRLKLDKNEPVVQPVYKADVSFVNQQQKGDKSTEGELRVPPLHISLRGRNSAVIKNSKKEKKKFGPSDIHKRIKIKKSHDETEEKSHRRDSDESIASKSNETTENKTDDYLHVKSIKLNNHYTEAETIKTEITGENNVVYRMKTIAKNAHIVTKHDYKLKNNLSLDKLKKKSKLITENAKPEKERDKEWRTDVLDKEGKYAQNEGYRETNNYDAKKKLPTPKDAKCDKTSDVTVQSDLDSVKGASEDGKDRLQCIERTLSAEGLSETTLVEARRGSEGDNKLKRTLADSAITSPNGLLVSEKKRKVSHSSCPEPPGSTNVGTIVVARAESPSTASQRAGNTSPRRKDRPKDKSYCQLAAERAARPDTEKYANRSPNQAQGEDSGIESMDALSEKSPNQASQSPPGPHRKERLDMPRSTSPTSVQRIIGVIDQPPPSDELLERLSLASGQPHYDPVPPDIDDLNGDIEAELAKMHADHINGDDAPRRPLDETKDVKREPTPILRDDEKQCQSIDRVEGEKSEVKDEKLETKDESKKESSPKKDKGVDDYDLPSRKSPPLYTYSNPEKNAMDQSEVKEENPTVSENGASNEELINKEKIEVKMERLPLKADFPDKSLLEQLLIEIPTPEYVGKRPESPSPSALERVARSSVRTRSSSKMNSPADGPKTPRLSPGINKLDTRSDSPALQQRNCLRSGSVDKTSPKTNPATVPVKPAPGAKRKRRESESSCASTISCEEGLSPAGRPKKKPRKVEGQKVIMQGGKLKKDSDSDSDEPLICKVRGKGKAGKVAKPLGKGGEGVGTRRSVRHPATAPPPPAPAPPTQAPPAPVTPATPVPVRRKTRSAVGEGATPTAGAVRRRRASRDGK